MVLNAYSIHGINVDTANYSLTLAAYAKILFSSIPLYRKSFKISNLLRYIVRSTRQQICKMYLSIPKYIIQPSPKGNLSVQIQHEAAKAKFQNKKHTSPKTVLSMQPLTMRAEKRVSLLRMAVIIGVLIFLDALIISLMRGTPSVTSDFS